MNSRFQQSLRAAALGIVVSALAASGAAAQQREPAPAAPPAAVERTDAAPINAPTTRQDLIELLNRHPPSVGRVIKLDPSLLRNEAFLAPYPQLRQFLAAHPEVAQNAPYYFEPVRYSGDSHPQSQQLELIETTLGGFAAFAAFAIGIGTLFWLIKTVVDQRRWNRLSKIQAEVHTKLMDRFSSNEELLHYVQTPSGRRFLESGPSPLQESAAPAIGAPLVRIIWSVQIGAVLAVAGIGLLLIGMRSTLQDAREFFFILGSLTSALGVGFVASAIAAYVLSRRFGLIDPQAPGHA